MSFHAIQWAFRQKCRNATQQMILTALANFANEQGICWPSKNKIADVCRLSKAAVCSNLTMLKADGYVTLEERGGEPGKSRQTSSIIRLNMEGECLAGGQVAVQQVDRGPVQQVDRYKNLSDTNQSKEPINSPLAEFEAQFEEWWKAYPKRDGGNPKHPAKLKYQHARQKLGIPHDTLLAAVRAYAASRAKEEPKFTAQAVTWLNQRRWEEYEDQAASAPQGTRDHTAVVLHTHEEMAKHHPLGSKNPVGERMQIKYLLYDRGVRPERLIEAAQKYGLAIKRYGGEVRSLEDFIGLRWRDMDRYKIVTIDGKLTVEETP